MALARGTRLGPYEVVDRIGSGGMGEVYRAHDARLGRDVAVKVLAPALAGQEDVARRFAVEARAAAMLNHANIMAIHDVGTHEGAPYVVCELLDGAALRDRMRGGPVPPARAIDWAIQIARGLAAAHDKGIVHRDLKPENLYVLRDGRVKILDFGIAKVRAAGAGAGETPGHETASGVILGSVGYMAPEQLTGGTVDHRCDLFALGLILYEMLAGRRPFGNANAMERVVRMATEELEPLPAVDGLPDGTMGILRHCMTLDVVGRYDSARDLGFHLESLIEATAVAGGAAGQATRAERPAARAAARQAGGGGRRERVVAALLVVAAGGGGLVAGRTLLGGSGGGAAEQVRPGPGPGPATSAAAPAGPSDPPRYRQLTFKTGSLSAARFTGDGQSVVYAAAWDGGPKALYTSRLDRPSAKALGVSAGLFAVSAGGEMAVAPRAELDWGMPSTLKVMEILGTGGKEVATGVLAADFAPDGRALALARDGGAGGVTIEYPAGHDLAVQPGLVTDLRVSPDGKSLAFLLHPPTHDDRGRVMLMDGAGQSRPLTDEWPSTQGLAWAPGGREIWFTAGDRGPDMALRAVTLDGRQRVLARIPGRLQLLDVAADGRALVASVQWRFHPVLVAPGAGDPRPLPWLGQTELAQISADGRVFTFMEQAPSEGPRYGAYLRATDGASPPIRLGDGIPLALAPDGSAALVDDGNGPRLVPVGAGKPRPVDCGPLDPVGAVFAPSGELLPVCAAEGGPPRLYRVVDGNFTALLPEGVVRAGAVSFNLQLSPDGLRGVTLAPPIAVYPLDGVGSPEAVRGLAAGDVGLQWAASGRELFVAAVRGASVRIDLLDPATGARRFYRNVPLGDRVGLTAVHNFVCTPDGRAFGFDEQRTITELYLVEGLD